ncbi:DUF2304 domain-containing protein [Longispora albida]|uniref:DUF2304 domain-containing protein n=1 Tax=Longispora albida TaxID=203523 RepID=UPI0003767328|nr:DUF2304 domain-containing protein [Longispora albida]
MRLTVVTATIGFTLLVIIFELLRRRQLREKYGILWLLVGLAVLPLAVLPRQLDRLANALGIVSGVSLVLFLAAAFLLLVCVHLSWETSTLEEETRTLAEEVALMRARLEDLEGRLEGAVAVKDGGR